MNLNHLDLHQHSLKIWSNHDTNQGSSGHGEGNKTFQGRSISLPAFPSPIYAPKRREGCVRSAPEPDARQANGGKQHDEATILKVLSTTPPPPKNKSPLATQNMRSSLSIFSTQGAYVISNNTTTQDLQIMLFEGWSAVVLVCCGFSHYMHAPSPHNRPISNAH